jgi:Zn-dependent protease
MQVSSVRTSALVHLCAVAVLAVVGARAQNVANNQTDARVVIAAPAATEDERLVLKTFEQFARAALAGQFADARAAFDVDTINQAHVTAEGIQERYRQFEAKYGRLKSITAQSVRFLKSSPSRVAVVAAVHEYQSKRVQFVYGFRQRGNGWTVLGFKEGNFAPGAANTNPPQGRQRQPSAGIFGKFFLAFFLFIVPVAVLVAAAMHLYRRHAGGDDAPASPGSPSEPMGAQAASAGKGSIRLFRFAGIDLFLHWSWFLVAAFEITARAKHYSSPGWNVLEYLALFLIVMLHEFGHALACRQVGGTANRIVLWPLGGVAYVNPPPRPGATLWSIAAGPLVNVLLASVFLLSTILSGVLGLAQAMPNTHHFLIAVTTINLILLVFNLLPIYPLDGGQILRSLLWFLLGRARSLMVATSIGFVGAAGLILLALWKQSAWLGVLSAFMLMNCWAGLRQAQALSRLAKSPRHEGFACPSCGTAPPVGDFWRCGECRTPFDAFQTQTVCPHCAAQSAVTVCINCRGQHPMNQWIGPGAGRAEGVIAQPVAVIPSMSKSED